MRDLTAAQVAAGCAELGLPISRSKIANIENGRARQEGVSLAEWLVLAAVLNVPPVVLLVPLGSGDNVEVLPGRHADPWMAYRWLLGEVPTGVLDEQPDPEVYYSGSEHAAVIRAYRLHDAALLRFLFNRNDNDQSHGIRQSAVTVIAGARISMQENGWPLPALPPDVSKALEPALFAWGWHEREPGVLVHLGTDITTSSDPTERA